MSTDTPEYDTLCTKKYLALLGDYLDTCARPLFSESTDKVIALYLAGWITKQAAQRLTELPETIIEDMRSNLQEQLRSKAKQLVWREAREHFRLSTFSYQLPLPLPKYTTGDNK